MSEVECARCGRRGPPIGGVPYPGKVGEQIKARVCADCWAEWRNAEVMVINELRLNFMDPRAQEVLTGHMLEFLGLAPPSSEGS